MLQSFKKRGNDLRRFPAQPPTNNTTAPSQISAVTDGRYKSSAHHFVQNFTIRRDELDVQRHLSDSMSRATQAGIVTADAVFDAVEHGFGNGVAAHIMPRDLRHG